jgi:hypothetical protein
VIFTLGPRPQVFITSETNCPSLLKVTAREGKGREGKGREGKLVSLFIAGAAISESITSLSVKVQNKFMKGVDVEKAGVINVKFPNEGDI